MNKNIEGKIIVLEPSATARVYSVKLNVACVTCGATWGVKVLGDYSLPLAWDECLFCKKRGAASEKPTP